MYVFSPTWSPSPAALWRGGAALLWTGFATGLTLLLVLLWRAPELLPALLLVLVATPVLYVLVRNPSLHLCAVLVGSALILEHEPGIQVREVVYGLYCIAYLGSWFIAEIALRRRNPFDSPEARALGLFMLLVILMLPVSILFGGTSRLILREVTALVLLGLVFPIKSFCADHRAGIRTVVYIGLALCVFVAFRNLLTYQALLHNAERVVDMLRGRVHANVQILAVASLFAGVFLLYARRMTHAVGLLLLFALFFSGVILSLSRGFWVAFASSLVFLFFAVERSHKARIVWMTVGGAGALLALGFAFFGDFVMLFVYGMLERFSTIQDATTKDLSMMARIHETRGVMTRIAQNPILGHGIGAPFDYYDILSRTTVTQTFVHNGYIALWFKFGVIGTVLVLYWWLRTMIRGLQLARRQHIPQFYRLVALASAASLSVFLLSTLTSNPFYHKDYVFTFAYLVGLTLGIKARFDHSVTPSPAPES